MNVHDENGWMVPCHDGYLEFPRQDHSGIAVTVWNHRISVQPHRHKFQEFALITKGYCIHSYRGTEVPLLPGDVFLIETDEEHSYQLHAPIELVNCQFFPDKMSEEFNCMLREAEQDGDAVCQRQEMIAGLSDEECGGLESRQSILNKQGVIHLNIEERKIIESLLDQMMEEQRNGEIGLELVKMACLQMILVKFYRIQRRQTEQSSAHRDHRKERVYEILAYMEEHLRERLDYDKLAERVYWSAGHFRSVFKEVTGLAPTEYMNRLRIIKSLEYMQREHLNVSQAAERVGFDDPGYYSRLFKKIMGYSPKYFRSSTDITSL